MDLEDERQETREVKTTIRFSTYLHDSFAPAIDPESLILSKSN